MDEVDQAAAVGTGDVVEGGHGGVLTDGTLGDAVGVDGGFGKRGSTNGAVGWLGGTVDDTGLDGIVSVF